MDYELAFGRRRRARKSPKRTRRRKSPVKAKKLSKKMLDSLTLKQLKTLAKKYKVSCYKKGTKVCVKKSTLLRRLKKSRSANKILKSASMMKKSKRRASPKRRTRFGEMTTLARNTPQFSTPLELALGQTYDYQKRHYKSIPTSLISQNFQGTGVGSFQNRMQLHSKNFPWTQGSLGRSSLSPYLNINNPKHPDYKYNRFGRYFH
jgi:hypothetical protein